MKINKDQLKRHILRNSEDFFRKHGIYFPRVRNMRRNVSTTCPFHSDRNPSFSVNLESGLWICFAGCGSGDIFSFYAKSKGLDPRKDFLKVMTEIAKESGYEVQNG